MMSKEYRNKLIATGVIWVGIILFTLIDSYVRYAPDANNGTPATEQVSDTEIDE